MSAILFCLYGSTETLASQLDRSMPLVSIFLRHDSAWQSIPWLHVTWRTFEETEPSKWQSRNHYSNATQFLKKSNIFDADSISKDKKIKRASILVLTFYQKIRTLTMVIR